MVKSVPSNSTSAATDERVSPGSKPTPSTPGSSDGAAETTAVGSPPVATSTGSTPAKRKGAGINTEAQANALGDQIGWFYNWNPTLGFSPPSGVEYLIMNWGLKTEATWADAAKDAIASGAQYLLGMVRDLKTT